MNAPVRIAHAMLKAVTTAAAHQAKELGLQSPYSRDAYAYGGLQNTSFSYAAFMQRQTDETIYTPEHLPEAHRNFITEGYDIDAKVLEDTYQAAIIISDQVSCVFQNDYATPIVDATELATAAPLLTNEVVETPQAISEEIPAAPVADAAKEWLKSPSILNLSKMPASLAIALDEKGIETYADLAKLNLENFIATVKSIKGGNFQVKKCEEWLIEAKQHGTAVQ